MDVWKGPKYAFVNYIIQLGPEDVIHYAQMNESERSWKNNTVFPLINAGSQISAASLGIHIGISASLLISVAPVNAVLIRIVTIFY